MGVGSQEDRAAGATGTKRRVEVRCVDSGKAQVHAEARVEQGMGVGRFVLAGPVGIDSCLGGQQSDLQADAAPREFVAHRDHLGQMPLDAGAGIRVGLELLLGVEPAPLADHQPVEALAEQAVACRGPEIAAEVLQRELLVVVAFEGVGLATVDPAAGFCRVAGSAGQCPGAEQQHRDGGQHHGRYVDVGRAAHQNWKYRNGE